MKFELKLRVLPNDPSQLRPLSRWVLETAHGLGLPANTCHDIDLCVHEAVSNIIRHGCSDPAGHRVVLSFEGAPGRICIQVEDDARPFNPLAAALPAEVRALEDAATRGYGIPLLRALTREVRYESVGGRNRLTLIFDPGQGS